MGESEGEHVQDGGYVPLWQDRTQVIRSVAPRVSSGPQWLSRPCRDTVAIRPLRRHLSSLPAKTELTGCFIAVVAGMVVHAQ